MLYFGVRCLIRLFSSASASITESVTIDLDRRDLVEQRVVPRAEAGRPQVAAHTIPQRTRLADVDRVAGRVAPQIDAGLLRQPRNLLLEVVDSHGLLCRL